jgi:hypothetical protein
MARMNAHYRVAQRELEANQRQDARDHRTPGQQMALLDSRLGQGLGAKKERAKLQAAIDKAAKEKSN